mgnify:CR=1 FL=1
MNICWFVVFTVLNFASPGRSEQKEPVALPDPIAYLKNHDAQIQAILGQTSGDTLLPALREKIKQHISSTFDFAELSRLALGNHWSERTPAERTHFTQTFRGIIEEQNFDTFLRYYREGKITYQSATVDDNRATVVGTVPLKREHVEIIYKMHTIEETWRVYDLTIDGVSTAEGNRRRYARYIEKKSYQQLITQLDKQLTRLRDLKE